MVKVTIDRFEGNMALVEITQSRFANLPDILIPDAKEGDVVIIERVAESQFFVCKTDLKNVFVLTPNGKYALSKDMSDGAKAGDYLSFTVDRVATEVKQSKIKKLMSGIFE